MENPSPLRYPGGKFKLSRLVELIIGKAGDNCVTYIEPFAGGAAIAIDLLLRNVVTNIVINDLDRNIYSFWKACVEDAENFIDRIYSTPVTLDVWKKQREIYRAGGKYSLDLAFATFFLNRTNHSGILSSGPIGGMKQEKWKLDVRYSKDVLIRKVRAIASRRRDIKVYNRDVFSLMRNQLNIYGEDALIYFDPPYYVRGSELYKNFFTEKVHGQLSQCIDREVASPWIVSYDDVPEICKLYESFPAKHFHLGYSLANNGKGKEVMFFKSGQLRPSDDEIKSLKLGYVFDSETQV